MKKFNELDLKQQSKALEFIANELRSFMQDEHMTIFFNNKQDEKQIREHVKKIAKSTVFDNDGKVLVEESLKA